MPPSPTAATACWHANSARRDDESICCGACTTEGIARWTEDHDVYEGTHAFDAESMIASVRPEPLITALGTTNLGS